MTEVYSGTFTFLLTDIEGSTRLWESAPAAMARALLRHDDIIASLIKDHGGQLVRSRGEGDSAFAVFLDAEGALRCAVDLQRAFCLEPWPASVPIKVRMALHLGPAQTRGGDFFGQGVNRAARLRAIANGGQLVISDDVHSQVSTDLPNGVWLSDLGVHRLKDLARPERVWQVGHPDLPSDFPPVRSLDARGHNLPVQLSAFVGREMEVLDIRKRLEVNALLTLTGPGGIGKTRLALQAAAESIEDFADGVWLIELATIPEPRLVAAAIAAVLGVREEPGRDLLPTIAEHLASQNTLLIFDNCEHLVEECAHVAHELLQQADALRILATSREPLRVYGEAIYAVPTLELPDGESLPPEELMASEAVRLFVDRASLVDREFSLAGNGPDIVRICRRLDGIPLAIELAAAQILNSDTSQIAGRLDDRLAALAVGPRTAPVRQQTLRAAIDWSYDLLNSDEQKVFARLGVFVGGFTLAAAAEVVDDGDIDAATAEALVRRLVERSLIVAGDLDGSLRYRILDTIRDYALERASIGGDLDAAVGRHIAWAAQRAHEATQESRGPGSAAALATFDIEHDNMRAALARALDGREQSLLAKLVNGCFYFWFVRGHFREGRGWFEQALEVCTDPEHRARLLLNNAQLANLQGDTPAARPQLEEAVSIARRTGDRQTLGIGLNALATVALQAGELEQANGYASEALTVLRSGNVPQPVAQALNILGVAAALQGDEARAYNYYEDALAISRESGMLENIARLLMNLGNMSLGRSDYPRAREYYEECRAAALEIGDVATASGALANLGVVATVMGDLNGARPLLDEALAEKRRIGDGRGLIVVLQGIANLERRERKPEAACVALAESLVLCVEVGYVLGMIQGLEALVSVCALETAGETAGGTEGAAEALRFASAAETARSASNIQRSPEDATEFGLAVTALRELLGEDRAGAEWAKGGAVTLHEAVQNAIAYARAKAS